MGRSGDGSGLLVVETREDLDSPTPSDEDVFVVREQLRALTREDYDRIYATLSNADLDSGVDLPVYDISWKHVIGNRQGRLHQLAMVGLRLRQYLDDRSYDRLVCGSGLDRGYRAVVTDIGTAEDVSVTGAGRPVTVAHRLQRVLVTSILVLPFLLDQLFGLLVGLVRSTPGEAETVFVPALGRLESTTPVLERATFEYEVVVAANASSWLWTLRDNRLSSHDPTPLSVFTSVRCLVRQLSAYVGVNRQILFGGPLERQYAAVADEQLDLPLETTVEYAVVEAFRTRMLVSVMMYELYGRIIDVTDCEKAVTGGLDPGGKSMAAAAIDAGATAFHIPHSIGVNTCPNPPPELVQFLAGSVDKRHYTESPQVVEPWTCVVTGRPYLTDLYSRRNEFQNDDSGPFRIVLTTQPFEPKREFVRHAVEAAATVDRAVEVVVKIHPSESPAEYDAIVKGRPDVTVADGDLHEQLAAADLTMTINSNTGLESIILGTPTVVVNEWSPVYLDPNYVTYGTVPVMRSREEIAQFLADHFTDDLQDLWNDEFAFVRDGYELDTDAAGNMLAAIERYGPNRRSDTV